MSKRYLFTETHVLIEYFCLQTIYWFSSDSLSDRIMSGGIPLPLFILRGLPQTSSSVTSLCFLTIDSKDYLICGTDCGQLLLWSLNTFRFQSVINNSNQSRIQHLIPFNDQFLCQHKNGVIDVFDNQFNLKKSYSMSDSTYCKCFLYSDSDDNSSLINPKILGLVSKTNNNLIELFDFKTDTSLVSVGRNEKTYGWPFTLHILPFDGRDTENESVLVIIGYENGFLTVFKVVPNRSQSQFVTELKCFESIITSMDFNVKQKTGICCSVGDVITVWTLNITEDKSQISLSLKKDLKLPNGGLLCCAIRADGRIFACGGTDNRIRLFALKSCKPLAVMDTHSDAVECLIFSNKLLSKQNQMFLSVGSRDKTISIWNLYNNCLE